MGWGAYDHWRLKSPYDDQGEQERALEWAWEAYEEEKEEIDAELFAEWREKHPFVPESEWEARTYYVGRAYFHNGQRGVNRTFWGSSPKDNAVEKWVEEKAEEWGRY